jgi:enediyne biosynthesis protein E4
MSDPAHPATVGQLSPWLPLARWGPRASWFLGWLLLGLGLASNALLATEAHTNQSGFRSTPLSAPGRGPVGFTAMPPEATGVVFTNHLSDARAAENQIRLNGSGVALGDVDGDGWTDIYLCRLEGDNVLYRNLGDWRFEEITARSGIACSGQYSTGAVFADLNGNGHLDLLVTSIGLGARLFLNDGTGRFTERMDSGLVGRFCALTMTLADIDGNGTLDLYVCNYRTTTMRSTGIDLLNIGGQRFLRPEDREQLEITPEGFLREHGEPDILYLNDGTGRFTPVAWTEGRFLDTAGHPLLSPPRHWSLSAMFRDVTGNGAPDLYVCGDFWSPESFWLNDGAGRFQAAPRPTLPYTSTFSMGLDFADLNRDGHDDFLVLDMLSPDHRRRMRQTALLGAETLPPGIPVDWPQIERNTLFLNRGDGTYGEIALFAGLDATEWSWCPVFLDVDLDGYEDLLIPTGHGFDTQDMDAERRIQALGPQPRENVPLKLLMYPRLALDNFAFRNRGDLTFEDVSESWGFDTHGISQGIAVADLDNDGDLDVVVNNMNSAAGLYRNNAPAPRIAVRLNGLAPNTRGIGAKIRVRGGPVPQSQEMISGGRFLSSDDAIRVFAAGASREGLTIEVDWRSGRRSVLFPAHPGQLYVVDESAAAEPVPLSVKRAPTLTAFEDVSHLLDHEHHEEAYDDFARQALLSRRMSQLGPGITWSDLDGDGWDDLLIAAGKGGSMTIFLNQQGRAFQPLKRPSPKVTRDQTTLLVVPGTNGQSRILAGSSNYEDGLAVGAVARSYATSGRPLPDPLPGQLSSTGPMAMADVNGNGQLDLFVGGRVVPGRYPEAATSLLFLNQGGRFVPDPWNEGLFSGIGLISGATFSDLDGDGQPDLVLACEWGPIRVFRNQNGRFNEITESLGLAVYSGWWNGVATGDLDGDGRLDIVATNWGRNTVYERYRAQPIRAYYGDWAGDGSVEVIEAVHDPVLNRIVPRRGMETLVRGLPFLLDQFPTRDALGTASVQEILGEFLPAFRELQVNTLESMIFLNRGDRFEARPLPVEAQWAPAFAVCIADLDGDGREDLFLSQNFFALEPMRAPLASGQGLWLRGLGNGEFEAVDGRMSGIQSYGEQRGAALSDYDGDGRVDIAIAQNAAATRLYRNRAAAPGLRVQLQGPPGNPHAIGASIRLQALNDLGPAREVQAGSGYWSQNSVVQVMATPTAPTALVVRWPWGMTTTTPLPAEARDIQVDLSGTVVVLR